ncbi:c-type cytochrome [Yoonia sediminilitoris]|uniref:Cbb3-type cytochrome c oxidase subunit III n=1 Tax=Yoonia sediminilitoris TaxID=1286148 RepID=A0A2T6KQ68_9RHOB|nr:cytochrome c [Yoonia sediminilitoris]PUB18692.1 cbb3-type cytochrome c oxidase subunit III [Yoonia sediminilitoris]RCW98860.1 cbb3-type cytochrome c oxidase subunit III [Yoonia sediminilitoris]
MRSYFLLAALAVTACVQEPVDGRTAYEADCAVCHGDSGKGDGPAARSLDKEPPDLTQIAARNGGIFPRTQVMSTIDGLDRGAHFSTAMPEFGAGDMGDTIVVEEDGLGTPVPMRLLVLTDYLESIQQ